MWRWLPLLALAWFSPAQAQTVLNPAPVALVCAYNSVIPSPTSGQFFYVQCDSTGKLITSGSSSLIPGTTPVACSIAGAYLYSDGTLLQCGQVVFKSNGVTTFRNAAGTNTFDLTAGASSLATFSGGVAATTGTFSALVNVGANIEGSATSFAGRINPNGSGGITFGRKDDTQYVFIGANGSAVGGVGIGSSYAIGWFTNNSFTGGYDVALLRDAANTLAQRNGANAQTSRKYATFTDTSNGAWAFQDAAVTTAGTYTIGTSGNGTGASTLGKFQVSMLGSVKLDYAVTTAAKWTFTAVIAVPGGANPALTSTTTWTSGAGAGAGTITNAPSAGNPTSWIPINDNGTTRYIPAW